MIYDLAIIGGGPAGVAAGVYAARKKLNTLFITKDFGGQSIVSPAIHNWIGEPTIAGSELAKKLENHLRQYENNSLKIITGETATSVTGQAGNFKIETEQKTYQTKTVLVTTGSNRRRLPATGADQFEHKGLTYCASCDGPMFADQDVAVIGGGNAGFETATQLLAYCKSVTLIHRRSEFKADAITIEKVKANPKMTIITEADILSVEGDNFVTGLTYKDKKTGQEKQLAVTGIFVEIGLLPNTEMVEDLIALNQNKAIITNPKNQKTETDGIWAAGDCTDGLYQQNNIAAGDAIKALEDIYTYIKINL
ncbi:MAG: NAD(P)/FAD-dependent oxidoreductase [Patescibacteria group bacterium]